MDKYFAYNKDTHIVEYTYTSIGEINNNSLIVDNIYCFSMEENINFTFENITEIYLNYEGLFEKRDSKPEIDSYWDNDNLVWKININSLKEQKANEILILCQETIVAGFTCTTSLGSHHYPTKQTDQMNLSSSILDAIISDDENWITPFWCKDLNEVWSFKLHNKNDIQIVGKKAKEYILYQMGKNEQLQTAIKNIDPNSETALEDLNSLTW